jgi:hypothetical protein
VLHVFVWDCVSRVEGSYVDVGNDKLIAHKNPDGFSGIIRVKSLYYYYTREIDIITAHLAMEVSQPT